jgi:hypothetical protein
MELDAFLLVMERCVTTILIFVYSPGNIHFGGEDMRRGQHKQAKP